MQEMAVNSVYVFVILYTYYYRYFVICGSQLCVYIPLLLPLYMLICHDEGGMSLEYTNKSSMTNSSSQVLSSIT